MTFTLGFSTGNLALVAADTRTYTLDRGADGLPQLGRLVSDDARKIQSVPGGWLVSNLPPAWKARLDDQLERGVLDARGALVASIGMAQQMLAELAPRWPAYADLIRRERMAWVIELDGNGPALYGFDYDGSEWRRLPDAAQLPRELPEADYRALASETFRAIGRPQGRAAVLAAVRAVAALFQEVARRGGPTSSVNDTIEIGLLWRSESGLVRSEHLRADAGSVAQATDAELEALLMPVGTSPAWIDQVTFKKVGGVSAGNLIQTASIGAGQVSQAKLVTPALLAADTAGKEALDDLFVLATKTVKVGTVASPSSITKTIRIHHAEFVGSSTQPGYGTVSFTPATFNVLHGSVAPLTMPRNVTITKVRARMYRETTSEIAEVKLDKVSADAATVLATVTHASTGWATIEATLSQLIGDEAYVLVGSLKAVSIDVNDARLQFVEIDYTMPSYDKGY